MIEKIKKLLSDKEKMKHYVTYFIFGVLTTIVGFVTFGVVLKLFPDLNENIPNIISIVVAILFAFFTNRKFVFKSTGNTMFQEFIKFISGRAGVSVFEVGFFALLTFIFPKTDFWAFIAKGIDCFFVMILNYIVSRFFVFKKDGTEDKDKNEKDKAIEKEQNN